MGNDKLNPDLMVGDEIMVVSTEGIHDFGTPQLFKPYVVVGIKYSHRRELYNWTHGEEKYVNTEYGRKDYDEPFYQIEPIGMTDEDRTGAMLAGGGRMKPMYIFSPEDGHRGSDQWILRPGFLRGEHLTEQEEPGLSPDLEKGDMIRVIDVDGEHARMPEIWGIYKVYDIFESGGSEPAYYQLSGETSEIVNNRLNNAKYLYREDTWIPLDTPMATKVDRLTISEHNQSRLNPELRVDDIVRVIDIDGEHGRMPERFETYRVIKVGGDSRSRTNYHRYYDITPYPNFSTQFSILDTKSLYRGDSWIYVDAPRETGVDRKTISEHNQPGLSPELTYGDTILVVDVDREVESNTIKYNIPSPEMRPETYKPYTVVDKEANGNQARWPWRYTLVPEDKLEEYEDMEDMEDRVDFDYLGYEKLLYPWIYEWIFANTPKANNVDRLTISEQKQEFNQPLTMGDIIRVVDVDKESTYEQPTYPYDTGNDSGNSLMTNHYRGQIHGQDTYPRPMVLYAVMSKSLYRTKDRDYLNPYWMLWPVDDDGKVETVKDFHEIILTDKDTWMTVKKHHSNIPGDIEAKQKEYDDSGRNIISRLLDEQAEPEEFGIIDGDAKDDFSDEEKREIDTTPFTPLEVRILKTLHKHLDRSELQKLSVETPENYGGLDRKFWDIMKLFGISVGTTEENTRASKYAKWALDNWNEEGNYNIENPHKDQLGWYGVEREESGSQIEYKSGDAEVLGFDEDDAGDRADSDFYAWGGEMETDDYGDYESYDSEITNSEFIRMDEGLSRVLREETWDSSGNTIDSSKYQDLLFNFWIKHGPTLDKDRLKLLGFNMDEYEDRGVVWDNLQQYYGDEELTNIIQDRLEGLHDSWSYEYIVTSFSMHEDAEIYLNILVNGDVEIPLSQESGGAIDMSLWDINEKSAEKGFDFASGHYEEVYDEVRSTISEDIIEVVLKDLPVDVTLDYMDISEPGTFETYVEENELEVITEDDDGYIDDMVYIDEPTEKHIRRMGKGLGSLVGFPLDKYKNMPPPENESDTTEEEIGYLEGIPVDKNLVDSADEIRKHFNNFLSPKGLEFPKQEIKEVMQGVKAIILILKYYYNRPRPWQIAQAKGLELNSETLQSSSSPSYPSGHATQGRFVGRYLSDLYPEYRDELMQIGDDIAFSRNMAKVHYPSDSEFGKMLGDDMYNFITNKTINESAPRPGSTSAEGFDDANLPYETKYMTLDEILRDIENIAYYEDVLEELEEGPDKPDGTYDWDTVNTVIRYADYWMENPESLTGPNFPPIQVIGSGMKDGSHRVSTLNALANNIDTNNPYWRNVELEVRFYDPEIVMDSGHFYPWLYDIPEDKLQDAIDNKSVYNWENLKRWKEEQDFDFEMPPFEFDQDGNEDRIGVDINNKKGWRRLASGFNQNNALNEYLNKHTDNYKWSTVPQSELFPEENEKMYTNPYIMYVHLLQTSQGKNNVIKALKGMLYNEPDPTNQLQLEALLMIWEEEEEKFKKLYEKYEDIIEKNSTPDNQSNVFSALKYAQDNFTDKKEIFKKFKLNGWSAYKFNLDNEGKINEQVITNNGDRLKSDIFKILSHTFTLNPTDYSEIKDTDGNYYGIYDIKQEEYVNMSDLIEGVLDFIAYGVESGDFKEEDIQKGIAAITDWVSLMMNQEKEYLN